MSKPDQGASNSIATVSNNIAMKTVGYRIKNEIEYLRALAEMYEHESNLSAREAALRAVAALRLLEDTLDCQDAGVIEDLPCAA